MLGRWFRRSRQEQPAPLAPPAPTHRVEVIGDVHGCMRHLDRLLPQLEADRGYPLGSGPTTLVTVGDYVDRGEQSAQVIACLMQLQTAHPTQVICLKGNHEVMLLDFLNEPIKAGRAWLRYGGLQTLASYQIGGLTETAEGPALQKAAEALSTVMQAAPSGDQEAWLRTLPLSWTSENLVVVHAGATPDLPMHAQCENTLLWGDDAFMTTPRTDGLWIAHGHTIQDQPTATASRIGTDTGAHTGGPLTAAIIAPGAEVRFLQA